MLKQHGNDKQLLLKLSDSKAQLRLRWRRNNFQCDRKYFFFGMYTKFTLSRCYYRLVPERAEIKFKIIVYNFYQVKVLALVIVLILWVGLMVIQYVFLYIFYYCINIIFLLALRIVYVYFRYLGQKHRPVYVDQHYKKYEKFSAHEGCKYNC